MYISEPQTTGKIILETNYGNIDIELFTREAPKSCKNFIQHCINKYYNGCIFFKILKNNYIQTGDPTNTGNGGESIYSEDFKDEFHLKLKFNHGGVVAMANKNKPNTNGSQFFITLDKCEEMNRKYTIFGKVTGPTFSNVVTISNLNVNKDGYPLYKNDEKPKIINTVVVLNPFNDLKPTLVVKEKEKEKDKKENKININNNINERKKEKDNINKEDNKKDDNDSSEDNESNESKSLSSDDNIVQNAKQLLDNDNIKKNKKKNYGDLKNEMHLLRKKIKREKEEQYNEKELRKEEEKKKDVKKMDLLEKFNDDYTKANKINLNLLSNNERANKLKNFKKFIDKNDSSEWFKTKLKFQTDSQKAFTLDMINKELEKNEY